MPSNRLEMIKKSKNGAIECQCERMDGKMWNKQKIIGGSHNDVCQKPMHGTEEEGKKRKNKGTGHGRCDSVTSLQGIRANASSSVPLLMTLGASDAPQLVSNDHLAF